MPKGANRFQMESVLEELDAALRADGVDPTTVEHAGFEIGDSLRFVARCGNCHLKLARFDTRIFADPERPDPTDWAGETYITTEAEDGPGMRKGSHSSNPPPDSISRQDHRWTLICPGRRCKQTYVVGQQRLSAAIIAAWRRGESEILAGVDF